MRTLAWLSLVAIFPLVGCRRAGASAEASSPLEWVTQDAAGRLNVRQSGAGESCSLRASEGTALRWSVGTCVATREDLRFLSPDGDRLLVLYPRPVLQGGDDGSEVVVARAFLRGVEVKRILGGELGAPRALAEMSRGRSWVRGVDTKGERGPREVAGGVELDLVEGAAITLGFDGSGAPRPSPPATAARAAEPGATAGSAARPAGAEDPAPAVMDPRMADDETLWRWEDEQGGLHFSVFREVPRQLLARASRVDAEVSQVRMDAPNVAGQGAKRRYGDVAPGAGSGFQPTPASGSGPRLNGLTDQERHEQEMARIHTDQIKQMDDETLSRERRKQDVDNAWRGYINRMTAIH